jgi:(5-formylfuran-3-yl)methyl phosphate synthase
MRLMISVLSEQEARRAVSGGAALLDVKKPEEGSLGAQGPKVIRSIRETVPLNIELSAAIGDMPNLPGTAALAALGAAVCGVNYIKIGLHGLRNEPEAIALMRAVCEAVTDFDVSVIAAGYADYRRIGALSPSCLPDVASAAGAGGFLIDTAVKDGQTLFDFIRAEELAAFADRAHAAGLLFGAAGSLRFEQLPLVRDAGVDVAGLRTAVCRDGNRSGPLDPARVCSLIEKFGPAPIER